MTAMIRPDGIRAAAQRELEAHPTSPTGIAITAWERRAKTLETLVERVNDHTKTLEQLELEIAELREVVKSRPF